MSKFRSMAALLATMVFADAVPAQDVLEFDRRKGLVIQKDSAFRMVIRFRMQNRFALFSEGGDDLEVGTTDIRVRRLRLRFDGFLLSPKLQYKVQIGFSKADMDLVEGTTAQPIRDAVLWYGPVKDWNFGIGQTKLPGNRQRTVSSGQQQFPERSIVNGLFTLDRDMGLFATWHDAAGQMPLSVKAALTTGEGRGADPGDKGLCWTVRGEWHPLGAFTNGGDEFEGDLEREAEPRLALAAGYSKNNGARRAGGQLGEFLPVDHRRTHHVYIADLLFKYRGTSLSAEYLHRAVEGHPHVVSPGDSVRIMEGRGLNVQLGRMIGNNGYELASRYSLVLPGPRIAAMEARREELWLGCSRYINHHRVKVQAALNYAWRAGHADLSRASNRWGLWLQMELGI